MPAGGLLGTTATDLFCEGVAGGSEVLRVLTANPLPALLALVVLVALIAWIVRRTEWTPSAPLHLARRRAAGQIVTAAVRMYAAHPLLFIGIGLITLSGSLVVGSALAVTIVLAPLALALVVLAAPYIPVIQLEGLGPVESVRRSAALVRHHVLTVAVLIAGLVYAVLAPIVAINTTYVYYNAVVHDRLTDRVPRRDVLPAELSGAAEG